MKVTILGNNSALPAFGRHPTAQIVSVYNEDILLDCGEGTQVQMQRYGIRWRRIQRIFISHLHGDHYFGLPGLINSMSLLGRTLPLHVYAPAGLESILDAILKVADTELAFPFYFHPLPEGNALIADTSGYAVHCFPVIHRISCHGFVITRKTKGRKLLPELCAEYGIPPESYDSLKRGEDFTRSDGFLIKNEWVTTDGPDPRKYAFCADTIYTETILPHIKGVHTLYHEATYLEADAQKAANRFHSTARQAAMLAQKAGVGQLLLGHFSSKYRELEPFLEEASTIFPGVRITQEGAAYEV